MPKRRDIKKVMVIGSGPIVIGQAAEFDYAGTQACLALKEEGYEVILVNSNPATIMTDTHIADKVYMEPLTLEYVAKIIRFERPDAIVPGLGGQTGLNLAVQLAKKGILKECQVEILGTSFESIERAEDRELFKELCESLGEPVIESKIAMSVEEAVEVAAEIGYPVVLRPAYTLGGTAVTYLLTRDVTKMLAVLMVDFSCALKLAIPVAVLSAMRESSGHHISVKGGRFLEAVAKADTIVFDKTGTLTYATPKVAQIVPFGGHREADMLRLAACLEEHYPHSCLLYTSDAADE